MPECASRAKETDELLGGCRRECEQRRHGGTGADLSQTKCRQAVAGNYSAGLRRIQRESAWPSMAVASEPAIELGAAIRGFWICEVAQRAHAFRREESLGCSESLAAKVSGTVLHCHDEANVHRAQRRRADRIDRDGFGLRSCVRAEETGRTLRLTNYVCGRGQRFDREGKRRCEIERQPLMAARENPGECGLQF